MIVQGLERILPPWLRQERLGPMEQLREIRLRKGCPVQLVTVSGEVWLERRAEGQDLDFTVNAACQYSPWTAETAAKGYLTAQGGHRIGICGTAVLQNGNVTGLRSISSLCIRVAKELRGIAGGFPLNGENVLILGPPGSGKTTLLRDIVRRLSEEQAGAVTVVDEREELFPAEAGFQKGRRTDVLLGCPKPEGIDMALRTMGPSVIALDEITAEEDCAALLRAAGCGVQLAATAHAGNVQDWNRRTVYRQLRESGLFRWAAVMQKDLSWRMERLVP